MEVVEFPRMPFVNCPCLTGVEQCCEDYYTVDFYHGGDT